MLEYIEKINELILNIGKENEKKIIILADWIAETIISDKIIHIFGTGHSHMVGLDSFVRAGGLANVNTILDSLVTTADGAVRSSKLERISGLAEVVWDEQKINSRDLIIVVSNSGRNAMPVEFAMLAKKNGNKLAGITSMEQSKKYPSRHASGKKLYEIVDLVIDNGVPSGDGIIMIKGVQTGGVSSILSMTLLNAAMVEGMKIAAAKGAELPVYVSQNIDGKIPNDEWYKHYSGRIKHM